MGTYWVSHSVLFFPKCHPSTLRDSGLHNMTFLGSISSLHFPTRCRSSVTVSRSSKGDYNVNVDFTVTFTIEAPDTDSNGNLQYNGDGSLKTYEYTVSESAGGGSISFSIWIVGLQSPMQYQASSGSGWKNVDGAIYVIKGGSLSFKVNKNPTDAPSWPTGNPTWSGSSGASGTGESISVTFNTMSTSTSDTKTVVAQCGSDTLTANVIVFGIDDIQYKNNNGQYVSAPSPLYVPAGGTVDFKATLKPAGANWPAGAPVWSGTSGASGSGETISVAFSTTPSTSLSDTKTVMATCGETKTVDVVVVGIKELQYKAGSGS